MKIPKGKCKAAFNLGRKAYRDGDSLGKNPYGVRHIDAEFSGWWSSGFQYQNVLNNRFEQIVRMEDDF